MKLIDTHAHLDHIQDLQGALRRADEGGVDRIVAVSIDLTSSRKNLEIKKISVRPGISLAMGMHPSDIALDDLGTLTELIRSERGHLSAVGEIGLDFWYKWVRKDDEKKAAQRKVFRALLELARELDLPAVVHSRGTWSECLQAVKSVGLRKAEFHWYSGPLDVLKGILDSGYFISASPSLAYSTPSREAVGYAPIDRVLIETDSPVFYRDRSPGCEDKGFLAEPKDVLRTLEAYCTLKGADQESALEAFNRNARDFFDLDG